MKCPHCGAGWDNQTPMFAVGFMPRGSAEVSNLVARLDDMEYSDREYTVCKNGHAIPTDEWEMQG